MRSYSARTDTALLSDGLRQRVSRLRHITGFVTTYGEEFDSRLSVFARLWHVQRVVSVAARLCGLAGSLDGARVERLAWLHDLNRWPFAHNSEKGLFDQASNVKEYFLAQQAGLRQQDVDDLVGIHLKEPAGISPEARIVLFADSLTGIVEDPLFAVAGLNVHPRFIPAEVDELLGFSLQAEPWSSACFDMAAEFHGTVRVSASSFQERFHRVFDELVTEFLTVHGIKNLDEDQDTLFAIARTLKKTFMRPVIFPLNNEKVCHSSWLRLEVMPWYFAHVEGARRQLLEIDEAGFVRQVTQTRGSPFTARQFVPDLGYVIRELPTMAFIGSRSGSTVHRS